MPYSKVSYTGVHKGKVQLVNAFYLNEADPNYDKHYVYVPVVPPEGYLGKADKEDNPKDQADYDAWEAALPHVWVNTPFHNHVLYFNKDTDDLTIKSKIQESLNYFYNFHQQMWSDGKQFIDEWKKVPAKKGTIRYVLEPGDLSVANKQACQTKANEIWARKGDFDTDSRIIPTDLNIGKKGTITIGNAATDRTNNINYKGSTFFDLNVPADGTGTLDTVAVFISTSYSDWTDFQPGTFYNTGVDTYKTRNSQYIGAVSKTAPNPDIFTGLSISVETGDFIGTYYSSVSTARIEGDISGAGNYYKVGNFTTPGDEQSYTFVDDRTLSLYGTGTESGGGWANIKNIRVGTGTIIATDLSSIWFGTTEVAVGDIAEIPVGVAV